MTELEELRRYIDNDERNIKYLEDNPGATGLERVALAAVLHWVAAVDLFNSEARGKTAENLFRIAGIAEARGIR